MLDLDPDALAGQEAGLFEQRIGDLHPRKGWSSVVLVCAICFKRHGNARDVFVA